MTKRESADTCAPTAPLNSWALGYPMLLGSVRLARLHVRRRLALWNWPGDIDDAVLIVSELVSNAVNHARKPGHEMWLRLARTEDGGLEIEVSDPCPTFANFQDANTSETDTAEGGRGLLVVQALAAEVSWSTRQHVGKTVRARIRPRPR